MDNIHSEICTKARWQAGIIYCKFYGHTSLLQLYLTFVQPHLEYAAPVWDPHQQGLSDSLERVQKFALRMCMRDWNADYATLLQSSNLPTLANRRCYLKLCFLYQVIHFCSQVISNFWDRLPILMHISSPCFPTLYWLMELPPPSSTWLWLFVLLQTCFIATQLCIMKVFIPLYYLGYNYQLALCYYCIHASYRTVIKKKAQVMGLKMHTTFTNIHITTQRLKGGHLL